MIETPYGPIRIDEIDDWRILRDDLTPGGTKARVLPSVLADLDAPEIISYASPVYGYAQIALAIAARATGRRAVIFCAARKSLHPRTMEAAEHGAEIVQIPYGYLSNVTSKAKSWCAAKGALLLPHGIDTPPMHQHLQNLASSIPQPDSLLLCAGSGTLTRAIANAWPGTAITAIQIGATPNIPTHAQLLQAPEKFEHDAKQPPPYPSCGNYDAKTWQFRHHAPRSLIWNVAA